MARFTIYSPAGVALYEGTPTFTGQYMKPGLLEFREVALPALVDLVPGCYVDYTRTGHRYRIYTAPQLKKQARTNTYGGAFVYQSVQLYDASKMLEYCPFRDLVLGDNRIHFSTQPSISTFEGCDGLARRFEACLRDQYDVNGVQSWAVRIADAYENPDLHDLMLEPRDFTVSGVNILECLDKIYEIWPGVGWLYTVENSVDTIVIGGIGTNSGTYSYGKGNGLTSLTRTAANAEEIANRIFAYGSSRNMLPRWYNSQNIKDAGSVDIQNLMIPVSSWGLTDNLPDAAKAFVEDAASILKNGLRPATVYFDGKGEYPEIYPSIRETTIGMVRAAIGDSTAKYYPSTVVYTNPSQRIDQVLSAPASFDSGLAGDTPGKANVEMGDTPFSSNGSFIVTAGTTFYPFYHYQGTWTPETAGLQTIAWRLELSGQVQLDGIEKVAVSVKVKDPSYQGPVILSSGYELTPDGNGIVILSGKEMVSEKVSVSAVSYIVNVDIAVYLAAQSTDKTGTYTASGNAGFALQNYRKKFFNISIRQVGFDINEQSALGNGKTIAMRTGKCAGRSFAINSVQYDSTNDAWVLECWRTEDESLSQWFPNTDYPVRGLENAGQSNEYPGDEFVLLDIAMPAIYVQMAEQKLLTAAQELIADTAVERWQYSPEIDAKFMVENSRAINAGEYLLLSDADIIGQSAESVLVDTVTINEGESAIPTYKVTLRDRKKKTWTESQSPEQSSGKPVGSIQTQQDTPYVDLSGYVKTDEFNDLADRVTALEGESFFMLDTDGNVTLKASYNNLWVPGWLAAGGIGTGGGGGTDLNRVWESLTNNTDFPNEKINLAHIPDVPYTQVTGLDSWIAGKGYLLPSSLKTVNGNSLVGSGNITIADGRDGKSAYQIWLDEGNVGTEADFLASLKGDTGVSADYPITIYNGLDSSATDQALAALQGKLLAARIAAVSDAIQAPEVDTLPYDAFRINLFNPADPDIESGYLIDQNGNLQQNANYFVTGYISFTPSMGKLILSVNGNDVTGYGGGIALYDSNKALIDVIIEGNVGGIVEWENKVAFARFSVPGSVSSKVQVEVGGTITPYLAYGVQFARDSFVVPGSLILDATVTGAKLAPGSVSTDKCDFFKVNLYNPDDADVVFGYFLDGNGTLQFNSNWLTTGYIPFTSGKMCASANGHSADGGGYIVLYDASKTKVASVMSGSTGNVATWQSGVAYARFSIYAGADDDVQVELGDTITDYIEPGTAALDPDIEVHSEIPDGAVTESKIANGAVTTEKCDFFKANLFDPSDQDVEIGYFLDNNGALQSNAYYLVTGYIPFTSGKMCASVNGTPGAGGGHLVLYDASKTKIAAYMGSSVNNVATWQSGVAYVRFSLMGYSAGSIQVETGDTITSYIPYGDPILDPKYSGAGPQVVSILGQDGERKTATSLSANANLTLDSFPYHIKKGLCMSLYADLSSFGNVYVGKGYNQYRGEWVKVTASNVVLQRYESGTIDVETVAHGLSISTFVKVALSWDNNGDLHVVVNSIGGDFQYTFNQSCFEANYAPFVRCESSVSNVVLSATCTDFRFPVWACGDSYFGVNIARWPGWMKEYGYFNFLLNGLAGQNSQGAFADLKRMMKFGCPKYLLWMLGMNDSDAAFENYFGQVKTLCEQNGITLIAATIPTVPERNKETISGLVRSSGLRYIDCYKAVGANSSGVWYTGYLDDGVHPTTLGAKALATQVLVDFPELMQYGLSS